MRHLTARFRASPWQAHWPSHERLMSALWDTTSSQARLLSSGGVDGEGCISCDNALSRLSARVRWLELFVFCWRPLHGVGRAADRAEPAIVDDRNGALRGDVCRYVAHHELGR